MTPLVESVTPDPEPGMLVTRHAISPHTSVRWTVCRWCLACLLLLAALGSSLRVLAQEELPAGERTDGSAFDEFFLPRTMRVDYYFSGNATVEHVALDRIVADGPWAGSRKQLIDTLDRGLYRFEVHDAVSDRPLYARGFARCLANGKQRPPPGRNGARSTTR